ncbi:MAG: hypothetical protein K6A62_04615 [Bacteroidales bacterium]|nr:hypothetical protein [Bacteroidales bacterium]
MRLKHTQARKANTRAFRRQGGSKHSVKRYLSREPMHSKVYKSHGCQVVRIQRIFLKPDRFGAGLCGIRVRFIKHAAAE